MVLKVLNHIVLFKDGLQLPLKDAAEARHVQGLAHLWGEKRHLLRGGWVQCPHAQAAVAIDSVMHEFQLDIKRTMHEGSNWYQPETCTKVLKIK